MKFNEIQKAAEEFYKNNNDHSSGYNEPDMITGFIAGANFVLNGASEGLEDWEKTIRATYTAEEIDGMDTVVPMIWRAARLSAEKEIEKLRTENKELAKISTERTNEVYVLIAENEKLVECVKDFRDFGTRHDINPTGMFKSCGCFDSCSGDNWQGYIRSQDESVRERARKILKELEEK